MGAPPLHQARIDRKADMISQDFHQFLRQYRELHPEDVLTVREELENGQDATALVWQLAAQNRHPLLVCERVRGIDTPLITNIFASRERVGRMLGVAPAGIHAEYQARSRKLVAPRLVEHGPVLDSVVQQGTGGGIDLRTLPVIQHFATDRGPYITNAILVAEHPDTGVGNMSYHRSTLHSPNEIATSLHSRGHLWRLLQIARERGQPLPVAMVIGAHPLFMLAGAARLPRTAGRGAHAEIRAGRPGLRGIRAGRRDRPRSAGARRPVWRVQRLLVGPLHQQPAARGVHPAAARCGAGRCRRRQFGRTP
jgi:3-polyprenyl-4-hydroxybenzoate decarboxylase